MLAAAIATSQQEAGLPVTTDGLLPELQTALLALQSTVTKESAMIKELAAKFDEQATKIEEQAAKIKEQDMLLTDLKAEVKELQVRGS